MGITRNPILRIKNISFKNSNSLAEYYSNRNVAYFGYARAALFAGLLLYRYDNSEVLVPNLICADALSPFHELNISIKYYKLTSRLEPDYNNLSQLINEKTKFLFLVDYFGFPQNFKSAREYCDKFDLVLIEDNTQGFLSKFDNEYLGTYGDIGIISLRKSLPLPNGAILLTKEYFNNNCNLHLINTRKIISFLLRNILRNFESLIKHSFLSYNYFKKYLNKSTDFAQEFDLEPYLEKISSISMKIIKMYKIDKFTDIRRKNFMKLADLFSDRKNETPIFQFLPEGIVPYCFPLILKDTGKFHELCKNNNIEYSFWPNYPSGVKDNDKINNLVLIPLHEEFNVNIFLNL